MLRRIVGHTLTVSFLAVVAAHALLVRPAVAVCTEPHPRVCAEFFRSDAVFVGTVIGERSAPPKGNSYDGWVYHLRVKKVYRGPARDMIDVFTENSSGRFPLKVGQTYLLFAYKYEGRLTIDNCGNSAELAAAGDAVHQIHQVLRNLKSAPGGDIGGRVVQAFSRDTGVAGIPVTARRSGKNYTGVTDKDGWFHIHVPPGKYVVWPEASNWIATPYELSYDNEDHVLIHAGGCAELEFLVSPR